MALRVREYLSDGKRFVLCFRVESVRQSNRSLCYLGNAEAGIKRTTTVRGFVEVDVLSEGIFELIESLGFR